MFGYPQGFQSMPSLGFVHGRQGADAFYMLPNSTAYLFDLDAQRFFVKRTDPYGVPLQLVECPYTSVDAQNAPANVGKGNTQEYVTKAEFDQFKLAIQGGVKHDAEQSAAV